MRFVQTINGQPPQELSLAQLEKHASELLSGMPRPFSALPSDLRLEALTRLEAKGVFPLMLAEDPSFDERTHKLGDYTIVREGDVWVKRRPVVALTPEELAEIAAHKERLYEEDMRRTAGLALVEWQAGDATQQDFLDAVAAVKALHGRT